jgi:hypothetical protein
MKDEGGRMKACCLRAHFILPPSSFIFHPYSRARRQAAKAPDCNPGMREFESHRALQFLTQPGRESLPQTYEPKEITK